MAQLEMKLKQKTLYNTILCQTTSDSGRYLFAGNAYGDVFILSLEGLDDKHENDLKAVISNSSPMLMFVYSPQPRRIINSLAFHRGVLVLGTVGVVAGYPWDENKKIIDHKSWETNIASSSDSNEVGDVNFLWKDSTTNMLFAGCGDNNIYQIDLAQGKIVRIFEEHRDYIHSIDGIENSMYSASEDGSILFWDVRENKSVACLEPYKNDELSRPEYGKWQGSVSVTRDWLVCGGGPKASMWHLRSRECAYLFPFPEKVHCSTFVDDLIIIAGQSSCLHEYSYDANMVAEVPISGSAAYSIANQDHPVKFLSVGGASNCLDIYTSLSFRDVVIKLYASIA